MLWCELIEMAVTLDMESDGEFGDKPVQFYNETDGEISNVSLIEFDKNSMFITNFDWSEANE